MAKPKQTAPPARQGVVLDGFEDRKYHLLDCASRGSGGIVVLAVESYGSHTLTGIPLDRRIATALLPYIERLAATGSPWEES